MHNYAGFTHQALVGGAMTSWVEMLHSSVGGGLGVVVMIICMSYICISRREQSWTPTGRIVDINFRSLE